MKKLAIAALLLAGNTYATTRIHGDDVLFTQGKVGSILNVCFDGEGLRSKNEESYCTGYEKKWVQDNGSGKQSDGSFEYQCTGTAKEYLTAPLSFEAEVCVKHEMIRGRGNGPALGDCIEYATKTYSYDLAGELDVEVSVRGGTNVVKSYKIEYRVPSCDDL